MRRCLCGLCPPQLQKYRSRRQRGEFVLLESKTDQFVDLVQLGRGKPGLPQVLDLLLHCLGIDRVVVKARNLHLDQILLPDPLENHLPSAIARRDESGCVSVSTGATVAVRRKARAHIESRRCVCQSCLQRQVLGRRSLVSTVVDGSVADRETGGRGNSSHSSDGSTHVLKKPSAEVHVWLTKPLGETLTPARLVLMQRGCNLLTDSIIIRKSLVSVLTCEGGKKNGGGRDGR